MPSSSCLLKLYCICDFPTDDLLREADRHLKMKNARTKKLIAIAAVVPAIIPAFAFCDNSLFGAELGIGATDGDIGGLPTASTAAGMDTICDLVLLLVIA